MNQKLTLTAEFRLADSTEGILLSFMDAELHLFLTRFQLQESEQADKHALSTKSNT